MKTSVRRKGVVEIHRAGAVPKEDEVTKTIFLARNSSRFLCIIDRGVAQNCLEAGTWHIVAPSRFPNRPGSARKSSWALWRSLFDKQFKRY